MGHFLKFCNGVVRARASRSHAMVKPGRTCRASGFTLIELLIVLAILSILAAIAIPAYNKSIMKSNRSAAKTALLDLAAREEKYYTLNNAYSYSSSLSDLFPGSTLSFPINAPQSGSALYTIGAPTAAPSGNTFMITATPVTGSRQQGDQCGSFTIYGTGQQTASGTGTCW